MQNRTDPCTENAEAALCFAKDLMLCVVVCTAMGDAEGWGWKRLVGSLLESVLCLLGIG